jgi:DNA polymerase-1
MPPVIYLIDGHALAYRTYYALTAGSAARFTTSSGEPTAGVFGFMSSLLRLLEQERPEYLVVAFDKGKSFRNDLFSEYKATRTKMPEDLRPQIERIKELVDAFHFPRLEMDEYEADDILGSLAYQAVEHGFGVKIITGDRDLLQLVADRIIVSLPGKSLSDSQDYTAKDVKEKLGVRPDQVVDYKALVGDKSDNIPGVSGIGQKTAETLFEQFDTLDEIYENLDHVPKRVRGLLEKDRESAYLSRELAEIHTDVRITIDLKEAGTDKIDFKAVISLFKELEFQSLIKRLESLLEWVQPAQGGSQPSLFGQENVRIGITPQHEADFSLVNTTEKLSAMLEKIESSPEICFDTETTSTDPMQANLVGISMGLSGGEAYYLPLGHLTGETQLDREMVINALKPYFQDKSKRLVGHNLKYDGLVLTRHGLKPGSYAFDTMIAEWLIDPSSRHLGLKDMADRYLGVQMTRIEELIGSGKNQISMANVPVEKAAPYAAADAQIPLQLMSILQQRMQDQNADPLFNDLEMPLIPVLADMEEAGIGLDTVFLKQMSSELLSRTAEIEDLIFDSVGYSFNLNSTQQLSKVLFETLQLPPPGQRRKTSSGHYSTAAAVLEELSGKHPVVDWVLEYRELAKLKSTYVDSLPEQVNPLTGRVHTSFNQTGSVTGRLASSDPNLQNIPIRTELGQKVRNAFIADEGNVLVSVDYSQIELRIVAHMSSDETMLQAFRNRQDIHATTAAAIYNIPIEQVSKDQRRHAKAINFGLIYGMSPFGLSNSTGLTLAEAEDFVKAYFQEFPGVKSYLEEIKQIAADQGYVETLLGRRRYFPNLKEQSNVNLKRREEREAINAPIQGTAADIIKLAMLKLPGAMEQNGLNARILLQVHDELILECPKNELEITTSIVRSTMEDAFTLAIPLLTDARWGANWGEMKSIES